MGERRGTPLPRAAPDQARPGPDQAPHSLAPQQPPPAAAKSTRTAGKDPRANGAGRVPAGDGRLGLAGAVRNPVGPGWALWRCGLQAVGKLELESGDRIRDGRHQQLVKH